MLLVFIDETSDIKFKDYLGFCIASINARFYPLIKLEAQRILSEIKWDSSIEFKGSYLFSASKGCSDVNIEKRIEAAHGLLDLNVASSNRRMVFNYGRMKSNDHKEDYLKALPGLLSRALPRAPKGAGKNLLQIFCDERADIHIDELHKALNPVSSDRGYILLERVSFVRSNFDTVGIMFADLVGYLYGRVDIISNDSDLFDGLTPEQFEQNGKIKKLQSSKELIEKIKNLEVYTHS